MKETSTLSVNQLIDEGIKNSRSYSDYRTLVNDLISEGKSTAKEQTEDLLNYSTLNNRRMKRLDKTIKIDETIASGIKAKKLDVTWLVLSEGWCGDAAQSLPVINKVAEINEGIDLRIVLRDENDALMSHFLTNGGKAIPKLIAIDNSNREIIGTWGPRPSTATKMVNDYKEKHGGLDAQFKEDLQVWYNKDKGENIVNDLSGLLA
ncbi:thioredoxin family protein [Aquimarina hainanensis]|uniref:Thioredoxin family protein n=1 Tax=Aquimarina hainanensis TaxID=1578017 RepID=A0ABW5N1S8_9FLAO|nr:thioredoxin family protein [Aquimarina sp. TRL1]QKX04445.1 thioredoxin family protein [Aquimarina sp. TRL1]